jgi:hypothetical protein
MRRLAEEIGNTVVEQLFSRLQKGETLVTPQFLSPRQASVYTNTPLKTLEARRHKRESPKFYRIGGRIRYAVEDLRAFIIEGGAVK